MRDWPKGLLGAALALAGALLGFLVSIGVLSILAVGALLGILTLKERIVTIAAVAIAAVAMAAVVVAAWN
jgi:hypothetical protein